MSDQQIRALEKTFEALQVGDSNLFLAVYIERLELFGETRDLDYSSKRRYTNGRQNLLLLRELGNEFFVLCVIALSARQINRLEWILTSPVFRSWWEGRASNCSSRFVHTVEICMEATSSRYGIASRGSLQPATDLPGMDCWTFTWMRGSGYASVIFLPLLEIASMGKLVVFHSRTLGEDGVIKAQIPYGTYFLESLFGQCKEKHHPDHFHLNAAPRERIAAVLYGDIFQAIQESRIWQNEIGSDTSSCVSAHVFPEMLIVLKIVVSFQASQEFIERNIP